jgi:hypothetical protein
MNMDYSLKIIRNGAERVFVRRGVADLFDLLVNEPDALRGASVVDKAVGKAAASLMVLGGVKDVSTPRISTPALKVLKAANIKVEYGEEVALILNRTMTDSCPLERRCTVSDKPEELLPVISDFIQEMKLK